MGEVQTQLPEKLRRSITASEDIEVFPDIRVGATRGDQALSMKVIISVRNKTLKESEVEKLRARTPPLEEIMIDAIKQP